MVSSHQRNWLMTALLTRAYLSRTLTRGWNGFISIGFLSPSGAAAWLSGCCARAIPRSTARATLWPIPPKFQPKFQPTAKAAAEPAAKVASKPAAKTLAKTPANGRQSHRQSSTAGDQASRPRQISRGAGGAWSELFCPSRCRPARRHLRRQRHHQADRAPRLRALRRRAHHIDVGRRYRAGQAGDRGNPQGQRSRSPTSPPSRSPIRSRANSPNGSR